MKIVEYQHKKRYCLNCGVSLIGEHPRRRYCLKIACQRERNRVNCLKWRSKNVSNKRIK